MAAELTESQINGRFRLLDKPVAMPGKCSVCGSVEREVLDFGLDVEFYGAVVICVSCLTEAAGLLDMVPGSKLRTARLVQQAHVQEVNEAGEVASEYAARISSLLSEFTDRLRSIYDPSVVKSNEGPQDSVEPAVEDTGKSSDPVVSKRSLKLSSGNLDGPTGVEPFSL